MRTAHGTAVREGTGAGADVDGYTSGIGQKKDRSQTRSAIAARRGRGTRIRVLNTS